MKKSWQGIKFSIIGFYKNTLIRLVLRLKDKWKLSILIAWFIKIGRTIIVVVDSIAKLFTLLESRL